MGEIFYSVKKRSSVWPNIGYSVKKNPRRGGYLYRASVKKNPLHGGYLYIECEEESSVWGIFI